MCVSGVVLVQRTSHLEVSWACCFPELGDGTAVSAAHEALRQARAGPSSLVERVLVSFLECRGDRRDLGPVRYLLIISGPGEAAVVSGRVCDLNATVFYLIDRLYLTLQGMDTSMVLGVTACSSSKQ